ncbi:MAG: TonB-dependent receptor [Elusimicrobia bacterium]|nr:TonB-dependent receptor [Elusimicrobiota bacterium]
MFEKSLVVVSLCALLLNMAPVASADEGIVVRTEEELLFMEIPRVVVASAQEEPVDKAPANVYTLTGEEMKNRGYRVLFDVYKDLPGVDYTYKEQIYQAINVRGILAAEKFKVLLNGNSLNSIVDMRFDALWKFPVEQIERVEFLLGPYAALYGRNAYAGVLNVVTKKGKNVDGIKTTALYGSGPSASLDRGDLNVLLGKKTGAWDVMLSAFHSRSDGRDLAKEYPDVYGWDLRKKMATTPPQSDTVVFSPNVSRDFFVPWANYDVTLAAKHDKGLSVDFYYMNTNQSKIGTDLSPYVYYQNWTTQMWTQLANTYVSYDWGGDRVSHHTTVGNQVYRRDEMNGYLDNKRKWSTLDNVLFTAKQQSRIKAVEGRWDILTAVSYESLRMTPYLDGFKGAAGVTPQRKDSGINDKRNLGILNGTFQNELTFSPTLRTVLGVTLEHGSFFKNDVYTPRLSVIWDPARTTTLKFLYGKGYVQQDSLSMVSQGQNPGINRTLGAKPGTLKPETMTFYELNAIQRLSEKARVTASVFYDQTEDLIVQYHSDLAWPYPYDIGWINLGERWTYGTDITADMNVSKKVKLFAVYGFVKGGMKTKESTSGAASRPNDRLDLFNQNLYAIVDHNVRGGVNVLVWGNRLNCFIYDRYVGRYNTLPGVEKTGGFNLVNVNVRTTPEFSKTWEAAVGIDNVLDKKAYVPKYDGNVARAPVAAVPRLALNMQVGYKF